MNEWTNTLLQKVLLPSFTDRKPRLRWIEQPKVTQQRVVRGFDPNSDRLHLSLMLTVYSLGMTLGGRWALGTSGPQGSALHSHPCVCWRLGGAKGPMSVLHSWESDRTWIQDSWDYCFSLRAFAYLVSHFVPKQSLWDCGGILTGVCCQQCL